MEKLAGYPFEWVLPGHGRRFHAPREAMRERMRECLRWIHFEHDFPALRLPYPRFRCLLAVPTRVRALRLGHGCHDP